ncbi:hypothetical protein Hanom_Chr09g00818611 [Helianthus anomalus]
MGRCCGCLLSNRCHGATHNMMISSFNPLFQPPSLSNLTLVAITSVNTVFSPAYSQFRQVSAGSARFRSRKAVRERVNRV